MFRVSFLHIAALSALAIAQPLFDLLGKEPTFFSGQFANPLDILIFSGAIIVLLPGLFWLFIWVAGLCHPKLQKAIHLGIIGGLTFFLCLSCINQFGLADTWLPIIFALIPSSAFVWSYHRFPQARSYVSWLTPAIILIPFLFLVISPVRKIVFPKPVRYGNPVSITQPAPVVFIIFDELPLNSLLTPEKRIDTKHFPNFSKLADTATWYRNATSVADRTSYAVPAILSGLYPDRFRPGTIKGYPSNLFTLFGNQYDLHVFESLTQLCPPKLCPKKQEPILSRIYRLLSDAGIIYLHILLPEPLKVAAHLPAIDANPGNFADINKQLTKGQFFEQFIQSVQPSSKPDSKPGLYFLHVLLPHGYWVHMPSGKTYDHTLDRIASSTTVQSYQRHIWQLQYTDRMLGRLLDRLKKEHLFDSSLIIITADHGISFLKKYSQREIGPENYRDIMTVPLFIKYPHQTRAIISDKSAETIDILPTLTDTLGMNMTQPMPGHSLLNPSYPQRAFKQIYNKRNQQFKFPVPISPTGWHPFDPLIDQFYHRPTSENPQKARDISVEVINLQDYSGINQTSNYRPAQMAGIIHLKKPFNGLLSLALSFNGSIVSTTQVSTGKLKNIPFLFLIPEQDFIQDTPVIQIFSIEGNQQLQEVPIRNAVRYEWLKNKALIRSSNGKIYRLTQKESNQAEVLEIQTESIARMNPCLIFKGQMTTPTQLDNLIVMLNGEYLQPVIPTKVTENKIKFEVPICHNRISNLSTSEIHLFALWHTGIAQELNVPSY